jgi:perosamine synthetase
MIARRKAHILKSDMSAAIYSFLKLRKGSGRFISEWESVFSGYLGVAHAIAVGSGRIGMELLLRALNLKSGDEIIIPAYTLKDLISIIESLGLKVVAADIDPVTFNINPDVLTKKITDRTRVILPTHLFGTPCQIDRILDIANSHDILVIEDCAHSAGATFLGKKTGSFGHAAFFSFETTKPINTYGGGMVVTDDDDLALRVRNLQEGRSGTRKNPTGKMIAIFLERAVLSSPLSYPMLHLLASPVYNKWMLALYKLVYKTPSSRSSYTDFQALIGLNKIKTLDDRIKERKELALRLSSYLKTFYLAQYIGEDLVSSYYFYVGLAPSHAFEIRRLLLKQGIDSGIESEIADDCGRILGQTDCPNATEVFNRAIQLPLYEDMSARSLQRIGEAARKAFDEDRPHHPVIVKSQVRWR